MSSTVFTSKTGPVRRPSNYAQARDPYISVSKYQISKSTLWGLNSASHKELTVDRVV